MTAVEMLACSLVTTAATPANGELKGHARRGLGMDGEMVRMYPQPADLGLRSAYIPCGLQLHEHVIQLPEALPDSCSPDLRRH